MVEASPVRGAISLRVRLLALCSILASLVSCRATEEIWTLRTGATQAGPTCDALTIGVTTFDDVLAAVGKEPESLQRRADGHVLACWYSWTMRVDPPTGEPMGALHYFLQCRFDAAGVLTWCRSHGYTPLGEGACECSRADGSE